MKKLCTAGLIILFIITGMAVGMTPVAAETSIVEEQTTSVLSASPTPRETLTVMEKVDYTLPYPGILPDHPLYNLKRLRDAILERLISDPVRKTEFYVLQSDKRLMMGIALFEQGKGPLAETTISKGEKYMEKAVDTITAYKNAGNTVQPYVLERLEKAIRKHDEKLRDVLPVIGEAEQTGIKGSIATDERLLEAVQKLK